MKRSTFLIAGVLVVLVLSLSSINLTSAAVLKGTVYNANLKPEANVLLQVDTIPIQKFLSQDGKYSFDLPSGTYTLIAKKADAEVTEKVTIVKDGEFLYDIFLVPDLSQEAEVLQESQQNLLADVEESPRIWAYVAAGILFLILLIRIIYAHRKYGSIWSFYKRIKQESKKTLEQHKQELAQEPGYVDKALEIIEKNEGRITQKELRKQMIYLSEAKVSLIITELEHKGRIEKIKKGRGNVIILK